MAERAEFLRLLKRGPSAGVVLVTFGVTILHELVTGIAAGCALAAVLAWRGHRLPEEGDA